MVGSELIGVGMCLLMEKWKLIQVKYVKWEYMWNMLAEPKFKKRIFELRSGKSICRYQWWLGKSHDILWIESWGFQYTGRKVTFNKHLGLDATNRQLGVMKKKGIKPAGVTSVIKGGGGGAQLGEYTNGTLLCGKKKSAKKTGGLNNEYWVGLRWLTGVDFWLFMDKHKHKINKQVPMFSKIVMIEQLDKLRKLKSQEVWTGPQEIHKGLVILNTGDHWMLAAVDYGNNHIVLMDPYGTEKDLLSVIEVRDILEKANWTVHLRKMSCQQLEDGNSCGSMFYNGYGR